METRLTTIAIVLVLCMISWSRDLSLFVVGHSSVTYYFYKFEFRVYSKFRSILSKDGYIYRDEYLLVVVYITMFDTSFAKNKYDGERNLGCDNSRQKKKSR